MPACPHEKSTENPEFWTAICPDRNPRSSKKNSSAACGRASRFRWMSDALDSPLVPPALREALRLSPQNAPLLLHVAETVLRLGGFNEAEALFKRTLAIEPT